MSHQQASQLLTRGDLGCLLLVRDANALHNELGSR